jgi:hypothetical protein
LASPGRQHEVWNRRVRFRFPLLDPLIPEIAGQIKHDWILNYLLKRGEQVVTASRTAGGVLAVIAAMGGGVEPSI